MMELVSSSLLDRSLSPSSKDGFSWRAWRLLSDVTENEVAKQIVDAAHRLHARLGPGLSESAYETALVLQLENRGLPVARQPAIPIIYDGTRIEVGFGQT